MVRILGARRQVSFSAQWYLVFTEVRNYQDTMVKICRKRLNHSYSDAGFYHRGFNKDLFFFLSLPLYYIIFFFKNQIFLFNKRKSEKF